MANTLEGKVIVITGAASGIGRATAVKLASLGAHLALCDINPESLKALSLGSPHTTYVCDVGASAAVDATVAAIAADHGKIDGLFNCAGVNPTFFPLAETTDAYFDKLVNTNARGPFNLTRAVAPHLKAGSAIVNVASTAGLRASAGFSIYNLTKFGIIGFTKAMAMELGPKGIRVNAVAPGPIDTPTMAGNVAGGDANDKLVEGIAMGRIGKPDEVADVVAFLFGESSRYVNGAVVEVSGGMR
ncbi:short-chain dehydrogenase/reductase-like protein SDR [Thozetella sp. PMI_491]|nr:short-chain dehydrogenase/reductase-like protein SDR [Thozetella sp. PMI_491]